MRVQRTARPSRISSSVGTSARRQESVAQGHRVWNEQPGGGSSGLGTSPCRMMRLCCACGSVGGAPVPRQGRGDPVADMPDQGRVVRDEEVGETETVLQIQSPPPWRYFRRPLRRAPTAPPSPQAAVFPAPGPPISYAIPCTAHALAVRWTRPSCCMGRDARRVSLRVARRSSASDAQ